MKELAEQLRRIWTGGSATQRTLGVLSLLVVLLGVAASAWLATRPDWALLFGNLEPADAGAVVEQVRAAGVEAEVRDGGRSVWVPRAQVSEMRMQASAAGLPRGGASGWELFDNARFGVSDYVQNVNYLRALQGELARDIGSFEGVERASVNITRPKRSPFASQDEKPKAAVIVHTRGGRVLGGENVRAIAHLVSGAVEGLDPGDVRIVDGKGRVLSEGEEDTLAAIADRQLGFRLKEEDVRRRRAQEMLDRMQVQADVRVAVEVEFRHIRETSERFDPQGTVLSQTTTSRTSRPASAAAGGPAGIEAKVQEGLNLPSGGGGASEEIDESETTTYGTGRKVTTQNIDSPEVKRLSVSLVVHEDHRAQVGEIEELVKAAVLFDSARGDRISSMVHAFETPATAPGPEAEPLPPFVTLLIERGVQVLGVLGALFLVLRVLRTGERQSVPTLTTEPVTHHGALPAAAPVAEREPESLPLTLRDLVSENVRTNPGTATRVLRSWIHGEDEG